MSVRALFEIKKVIFRLKIPKRSLSRTIEIHKTLIIDLSTALEVTTQIERVLLETKTFYLIYTLLLQLLFLKASRHHFSFLYLNLFYYR